MRGTFKFQSGLGMKALLLMALYILISFPILSIEVKDTSSDQKDYPKEYPSVITAPHYNDFNRTIIIKQSFDFKASLIISIGFGASISIARVGGREQKSQKKIVDNTSIIVYNKTKLFT